MEASQLVVGEPRAAFAAFYYKAEIQAAISELRRAGFPNKYISILFPTQKKHDFPLNLRTSIVYGASLGAIIGIVIFGTIAVLVSREEITDPDLPASFEFGNQTLLFLVVFIGGILFSAACGALVGIGTPGSAARLWIFYECRAKGDNTFFVSVCSFNMSPFIFNIHRKNYSIQNVNDIIK